MPSIKCDQSSVSLTASSQPDIWYAVLDLLNPKCDQSSVSLTAC